jgi:signal transduction histidine kinase
MNIRDALSMEWFDRASPARQRLILAGLAVLVSLIAAMIVALVALDVPSTDAVELLGLLVTSTAISLAAGAAFFYLATGPRWNRLSARVAAAHVVGVVIVLLIIIVTAYTMFISSHDLWLLGLLLGYSAAISLIFSLLASASIGESLRGLSDAASRMANGDLTVRVPVSGESELAEVAESFNTMAARLEAAFARQRELEEARQGLIAAVSHDLRTPLASLRVMVEAIADGVASDPITVRRYVSSMEREIIHLGKLIDDLFEMARLDAEHVSLRLEPSAIGLLVTETLEAMDAQAARQHIALQARVGQNIPPVMIDPDRIQRVLYNLVQNAIRHTPADGSVVVEVFDRGPDIQVNVCDTGEGIPDADLPHVFERFYRSDKSRSRDDAYGSAGLGLAIARRLVETHGGRIWVAQPPTGGSVFSFTVPKEGGVRATGTT